MGKRNKRSRTDSEAGLDLEESPSKRFNGSTINSSQLRSQNLATKFDNDDDEDELEQPSSTQKLVNFKRMQEFLEALSSIGGADIQKRKAACNLDMFLSGPEWSDVGELQSAFRVWYKSACSLKHVPLITAVHRVLEFMNDEVFVTLHPEFPKPPLAYFQLLCKKVDGTFLTRTTEASRRIQTENDELVIQSKKEAEMEKDRYYNDLRMFLEKHFTELLPAHVTCVEMKLRKLDREKAKKEGRVVAPSPRKPKVKKLMTAFDYYKQSKRHKFLDLSPEEREAKLLRHFNKLDDEKKAIFLDLSSNA